MFFFLTSVIINYFDVVGVSLFPFKADPILIVDSNAVLALSVCSQFLQAMTRNCQIVQGRGGVQPVKPHPGRSLDRGEPLAEFPIHQLPGVGVLARLAHTFSILRDAYTKEE